MISYTKPFLNLSLRAPRRLEILRNRACHVEASNWRTARTSGYHEQWMSVLTAGSIADGKRRKKVWTTMQGPYFKRQCFASECETAPRSVTERYGWFTDGEDMSETARGVVARLPHRRFLAGYYWSSNGEYVYTSDVYDEERDAAIAADSLAQLFGEEQSEYEAHGDLIAGGKSQRAVERYASTVRHNTLLQVFLEPEGVIRPIGPMYLWYCGAERSRITAIGDGSQDAFSRLTPQERQQVTIDGEFCVVISQHRQINAPYSELFELYQQQTKGSIPI